jgi:hypothetical protein
MGLGHKKVFEEIGCEPLYLLQMFRSVVDIDRLVCVYLPKVVMQVTCQLEYGTTGG